MANKSQVTIRIPDDEYERFEKFARDHKITVKQMIKDAFDRIAARQNSEKKDQT